MKICILSIMKLGVGYLIHYNHNKTTLKTQVEELSHARSRVQHAVDAAKSNGQLIEDDVVSWLTKANEIKVKVDRLLQDDIKMCLCGWCPNLISRFSISRKAEKMTGDVNFLIGKGSFGTVSYPPAPPSWAMVEKIPAMDYGFAVLPPPPQVCRQFTLAQIQTATNSFDKGLIIGDGSLGTVYKGYIDDDCGNIPVAIKQLKPASLQFVSQEFLTEIEMLSRLRHRHLLSLIGHCNEGGETILVYNYMARGTLREHLYKTGNPPLSWEQRLEICVGAARGLDHLHAGVEHTIIQGDVKATNILLDENWVAKVSDFGLSKVDPTRAARKFISTNLRGGYLDPEYFRTQHLTEKSDVYAFGMVLFEVLCGRAALDSESGDEKQYILGCWALNCVKNGTLDQIIDPYLMGKIAPECLRVFTVIANKCIRERGNERPKMSEVVWSLESALELQLQFQKSNDAAKEVISIETDEA